MYDFLSGFKAVENIVVDLELVEVESVLVPVLARLRRSLLDPYQMTVLNSRLSLVPNSC